MPQKYCEVRQQMKNAMHQACANIHHRAPKNTKNHWIPPNFILSCKKKHLIPLFSPQIHENPADRSRFWKAGGSPTILGPKIGARLGDFWAGAVQPPSASATSGRLGHLQARPPFTRPWVASVGKLTPSSALCPELCLGVCEVGLGVLEVSLGVMGSATPWHLD